MLPTVPPEIYGEYLEYATNQPQYRPLVARRIPDGTLTTLWQLTDEERQAVANGANIYLELMTFNRPLQPVLLWVEGMDPE